MIQHVTSSIKHAPRGPWNIILGPENRIYRTLTNTHMHIHTKRRARQDPVSANLHAYSHSTMFTPKTIKSEVDFTAFEGNFAPLERCYNAIVWKLKRESPIPPGLNIVVSTFRQMRFGKLAMGRWCKISCKRLNFFVVVFRPILKLRGRGGDVWDAWRRQHKSCSSGAKFPVRAVLLTL